VTAPGTVDAEAPGRTGGGVAVRLQDVTSVYGHGPGATTALDGLSLDVRPGEFVCLVGASGCGKSTLLSIVSGLQAATSGTVEVPGGQAALMFQEAALMPWLTAAGNVELALRLAGVPRDRRAGRARELLDVVRLRGVERRRPHELSGGMRQRVALARTLATGAPVLLMDEPFGALDAMTRDVLHEELERIYLEQGLTVVFVTHNVREAVRLGDRVVLLSSRPGRVVETFDAPFARPRRIDSPEVSALAATVTDRLRAEVSRHGR
jgi:NitT/TauT family transport system ATP-binding protein